MSSPQSGVGEADLPSAHKLAWSSVIARTYSFYSSNFWSYFRIAIVPAVAAYFFQYFMHLLSLRLTRSGMFLFPSAKFLAVVVALGWLTGAGFWIISAFFLAAVSANFAGAQAEAAPALADAYTLPRKRVGAVLAIAMLTWTLFWLGRSLAGLALFGFFRHLDPRKYYWTLTGLFGVMLVLVAGLISKFGLAIPELMDDLTLSPGDAIKRSWRRTAGCELFFMMFLIKSAILGYFAYWITGYALSWIWQHWTYGPEFYSWIEWGIYICIAAALESPFFIAFSVLSRELRAQSASMPNDGSLAEIE